MNKISCYFNIAKDLFNRAAVLLLWLVVLDICTLVEEHYGITYGFSCAAVVILGFFVVHIYFKRPMGWSWERLIFKKPHKIILLLGITLTLVLGDIFWVLHTRSSSMENSSESLLFIVLAMTAFPLIEEVGFRLWIQTCLEKAFSVVPSVFIVAIIFALVHSPDMPVPQFLAGVCYGFVLVKTNSIWIPVALHIIHNTILILLGKIPTVHEAALRQMDVQSDINLYVAIIFWILATTGILLWIKEKYR